MSSKKSFYIPEGMTVTGTFTVDVPGKIAGAVNGDVFVNGKLIILKNAVVTGNVTADELEISGSVMGDIQCKGKIILQNACLVKGNIKTIEIHLEKDAVVDGIITKPGKNIEQLSDNESDEEILPAAVDEPLIAIEAPVTNKVEEEEMQSWF